jgi:hypothetical protein
MPSRLAHTSPLRPPKDAFVARKSGALQPTSRVSVALGGKPHLWAMKKPKRMAQPLPLHRAKRCGCGRAGPLK